MRALDFEAVHQAWWRLPVPTELSHQPRFTAFDSVWVLSDSDMT